MLALLAVAVLIPLLYIPGALVHLAAFGAAHPADRLARIYERVAIGALLNGWLAFLLAELGLFSAPLHLALVLAIVLGAAAVARWRGALHLPVAPIGIVASGGRRPRRRGLPNVDHREDAAAPRLSAFLRRHGELLGFVAVGLAFGALVARPFEVILGARDAGVYALTGFSIARTGGIVQYDPLVASIAADQESSDPELRAAAAQAETNFLGVQNRERFIATRLRAAGFMINEGDLARGRIVPQFFHLYPSWIGLLAALLGERGGLLATGVLGLLGVWSVGMIGRRLAGGWAGFLAALLLAINGVQVWFSRYSTSEAAAQFLCFAALYFFAAMAAPDEHASDDPSSVPGGGAAAPGARRVAWSISPPVAYGFLSGVAAGQLVLVRIDSVFLVVPLLVGYLLYCWLTRRWRAEQLALAVGLGAILLHAALHIAFIARSYFFDTGFARFQDRSAIVAYLTMPFLTDVLREIYQGTSRSVLKNPWRVWIEVGLLVALVTGLVLLRRDGRPLALIEGAVARWGVWLSRLLAVAVLLIFSYAYLVRPQIISLETLAAVPRCLAPAQLRAPDGPCLALQGYIGAPIAPPAHPDPLAYLLDSIPKWLSGTRPPPVVGEVRLSEAVAVREMPGGGLTLSAPLAGESLQVRARSQDASAYLVTDGGGVTGWVAARSLGVAPDLMERLPVAPPKIVAEIVNPRAATSFSPTNPGESEKIALSQANLVRFGWYLSPLGVLLGIAGLSLWLWRGLNRASWLLLAIGLFASWFWVRQSYGTSDQTYIYILRRYVPQVYPLFALGIGYALVALATLSAQRSAPGARRPMLLRRTAAGILVLSLVAFGVATNRTIFRHVEYQGAIEQIDAVAARFDPRDVILVRGGDHVYGSARDLPDLVVTPLTFAGERNAFTIKSREPGRYAEELARYIRRWQDEGREVYLMLGASGAVGLPGFRLEPQGRVGIALGEFEPLTDQKPSNVQKLELDYALYRLSAESSPAEQAVSVTVTPRDYAVQVRGLYHPEQIGSVDLAWTDGDALIRLPLKPGGHSTSVALRLSSGETRPASLGAARACLSLRPETDYWVENPDPQVPFTAPTCFELTSQMASYSLPIDPALLDPSGTGSFLLRVESDTWVPAAVDPAQHDRRALGVQFGGLTLESR